MKKTLIAIALSGFSALASAAAVPYSDSQSTTFAALANSATVTFNWLDLSWNNPGNNQTVNFADGSYTYTLKQGNTPISTVTSTFNDTSALSSGSFTRTFGSLTTGQNYTLSFVGNWTLPNNKTLVNNGDVSFNVSMVPEPESYAMFLAGLGVIGAVVKRRKNA